MVRKLFVVAGIFCASRATLAQPKPDTIDSLARAWSGGRSTSLCNSDRVGNTESGASTCDWLLPQGQNVNGHVTTNRFKSDSAMVIWQRDMSVTEMRRVVDSLGYALQLRGMTMRLCRPSSVPTGTLDARVWEDKKLLVYISSTTPPSSGPAKMLVIGTDQPGAYPDAVCPRRRDPSDI